MAAGHADEEASEAQEELARREGLALCLEGALCFAALKKDVAAGRLGENDRVVVFNTATSLTVPRVPGGAR